MDEQAKERLAKNEALFRDINERVRQIDEAHGIPTDELWDFLCECGSADCLERVGLTLAEYERVRGKPTQFVLVPGHEVPEVERVVDETRRYVIVDKHPEEQQVALETDPRA